MIKHYLVVQRKIFYTLGYNLYSNVESPFMKAVTYMNVVILILFVIPMLAFIPPIITDIDLVTESLASSCTGVLCSCKVILFRIYRKNFVEMISKFQKLAETVPERYLKMLEKENKIDNVLSKTYFRASVFTGIASVLAAFIKMGYYYHTTNQFEYILPFNGLYPYDYKKLSTYILTMIWTFYVLHIVISGSCALDTLFNSCTFNLAGHYKILQRMIMDIKPGKVTNRYEYSNLKLQVKAVLVRHQEIIEMTDNLNSVFKPVVFMQFLITSLQICAIGYQLAIKLTDPMVIYFSFFLAAIVLQLFIYSYGGNRIRDESEGFGTAVYLGYWYLMPPSIAKDLLLAMQRGQKGNGIDSIFFEANLPTFNTIISSAMSYITLLRSFEEN